MALNKSMKTLIVCGDSYMSPVTGDHAGTHFSELVAKELGYDLIAYSRGGMSNMGIAIQIQTAIDANPDLILVGNTSSDRFEWAINEYQSAQPFTVRDILYSHNKSLSSTYPWLNQNPKIASASLNEIENDWNDKKHMLYSDRYRNDRKLALTYYFQYLYHYDLKREADNLIMYAAYHKLHMSGIPYLICMERFIKTGKDCSWLSQDNYPRPYIDNVIDQSRYTTDRPDPGYHLLPEDQQAIAKLLLDKFL